MITSLLLSAALSLPPKNDTLKVIMWAKHWNTTEEPTWIIGYWVTRDHLHGKFIDITKRPLTPAIIYKWTTI